MNRRTFQLIIFIFFQFLIACAHLFLIDVLPSPFNHFNLVLTFLVLYIAVIINPREIWTLFPLIWFTELFSGLPFGVNASVLILVILLFNLVLLTVFSNRSLPTIALSSFFVVILYRFLLWLVLKVLNLFIFVEIITINSEWIVSVIEEIFFTTLIAVIIYLILSFFLKRLRPEYITAIQKEYESKRYFR